MPNLPECKHGIVYRSVVRDDEPDRYTIWNDCPSCRAEARLARAESRPADMLTLSDGRRLWAQYEHPTENEVNDAIKIAMNVLLNRNGWHDISEAWRARYNGLKKYVKHYPSCDSINIYRVPGMSMRLASCTCGLSELLRDKP